MILRSLQKSPEKMAPLAMALITIGLALLMIGLSWPRLSFHAGHLMLRWSDFTRGFLFGIALVLEISGVAIAASAASLRAKKL
jgi:hypothetical protein